MPVLFLLTHVATDAVNEGFLPAALRLGLKVIVLTDQPDAHRRHFATPEVVAGPHDIIACDVFNPVAVITEIGLHKERPAAIFSNSDHLQTSAAMAAEFFGLPGKDWKATYRAKNKAAMRSSMNDQGIDGVWHAVVTTEEELDGLDNLPLPCVVKPREGVGSQLVRLCEDRNSVILHCRDVWTDQSGRAMLIEEYLAGELYTLETLGDGKDILILGGFHVTLGPPPNFVEMEGRWSDWLSSEQKHEVLRQIKAVGVGFGSCHTEFVLGPTGPRIIEINYRTVGDHMEFMLEHTLDITLFEKILRLHLGEPLGECHLADKVAVIRYFPAVSSGRIAAAPVGFFRADEAVRVEYRAMRKPGDHISVTHSNKDYLGVLSVSAPDFTTLDAALKKASAPLVWEICP